VTPADPELAAGAEDEPRLELLLPLPDAEEDPEFADPVELEPEFADPVELAPPEPDDVLPEVAEPDEVPAGLLVLA
jgi:hypothetical protein